jgi:hypothetical protein
MCLVAAHSAKGWHFRETPAMGSESKHRGLATDDPIHGEQEGRCFHGYYKCYCYLPLYVFCGARIAVSQA